MINQHQQQKSFLQKQSKNSYRDSSYYRHPKIQSLNELPPKTLEHQLFSFQDLSAYKECEGITVEKDLSNFKKYLNQSPTFKKKQSEVSTKTESLRRLKMADDHQTLKMKQNLQEKMEKAHRILQQMKEGLKTQQQKKYEIISNCDMRRSQLRDSSFK